MNTISNISCFKNQSNLYAITNLLGLFKTILNSTHHCINYYKLPDINYKFHKSFSYLRREYVTLTNYNLKEINNKYNYSVERNIKIQYTFKNNNIIQNRIDEKRFLHSLIKEQDDSRSTNFDNTIKKINISDCNVNKKIEVNSEKQNEIVINPSKIEEEENNLKDNININSDNKTTSLLKHIPNILCISRILFSPYIGYLITKRKMKQACILYAITGITDFLDGYLARKYHWTSKLGSVVDPLADKTLMIISTVSLSIAKLIPKYLGYTILSRDIFLLLGSFVLIGKKAIETGTTLDQFKNISIKVKPSYISKYVVFSTTVISGLDYFIKRNAIDIKFNNNVENKQINKQINK
ncbi:hypothetical protein BCR32DRAFT_248051 [Anaeromyces robustus]|uniref:CDP-alcohol phosphatidyltransferase n=1 Tax=Anaeromyces robustus TaxID=1754192 RepID=A0A1Y1WVQ9_9FUNG|nr:hypothetical protein BCR32DRAFT_248051 [Anaeromyces robustus]|eukprot:ORX77286.1 hypothetical protein BCR32DRAFT_248051 [Anaeromyces robustus]